MLRKNKYLTYSIRPFRAEVTLYDCWQISNFESTSWASCMKLYQKEIWGKKDITFLSRLIYIQNENAKCVRSIHWRKGKFKWKTWINIYSQKLIIFKKFLISLSYRWKFLRYTKHLGKSFPPLHIQKKGTVFVILWNILLLSNSSYIKR